MRVPNGVSVRNSTSKIAPNCDVRGNTSGGYVLGPGSIIHGVPYVAIGEPAGIVEIPEGLLKQVETSSESDRRKRTQTPTCELDQPLSIEAAVQYLKNNAPIASENAGGDGTTYTVAARLKDLGVSEAVAFDLMAEYWNRSPNEGGKADPPWHPAELAVKIGNAYRYGRNAPGKDAPSDPCEEFSVADEFVLDRGRPCRTSQHNIRLALRRLGVTVRHDVFQDRLLIDGLAGCGPLLDDHTMERMWLTVDAKFRFRPTKDFFWTVVSDEARRCSLHPVLDYLDSLVWDGKPRIDKFLSTYAGAESTPYTDAVGALMLIAAVRRVRKPGCKFDEMPVLEGAQGTNKSTALRILAEQDDWFSDDLPLGNVDSKRVIEALAGRWIVEAAELNGMKRGDIDHLKAFLSRTHDRARMSYDRLVTEVARQCVIIGTTNSAEYLRDSTGNRRFWPVAIKQFDIEALRRDRDQLWAEAAAREAQGESIRLSPSLWGAAADEQSERRIADPWEETIGAHLDGFEGLLRIEDAWKLVGVPAGQRTQPQNQRLGDAMRQAGWERTRRRDSGDRTYVYKKGQGDRWLEVWRDPQNNNAHVV
jgi:hypothetical protein